MSHIITVEQAGLSMSIRITPTGDVRLIHCSALPHDGVLLAEEQEHAFRLVEVQCTGMDRDAHHGIKHVGTHPGQRLRYRSHHFEQTSSGQILSLVQADPITGLEITSSFQYFYDIPVLRAWSTIEHRGTAPVDLEYLSSFCMTGLAQQGDRLWEQKMQVGIPHNTWCGEAQWQFATLPALGLAHVTTTSTKSLGVSNLGTWSSGQFLPLGYIENTVSGEGWLWQIEHSGSWQWEIGEQVGDLYVQISGPTDQEHHWWKRLLPGASFTSVPVAIALGQHTPHASTFENCIQTMTQYRRRLRRPHWESERLPVIFNDFMNCLEGDPTEAKELPLIAAAAQAECDIYCIDAGWYADQGSTWWDNVGAWEPSLQRFPHGLAALCALIREHGMIPGLWVEIEVMGMNASLARTLPDTWFFYRHGQRVVDHGRYQLDFRHPDVRGFADTIIDRLVQEYGVGYLKIDYNINAGVGTDIAAVSPGDGLLEHNRAYLHWLDTLIERYPDLIVENCGSGGMRMDYALLSRHHLQSVTDQTDYRLLSVIAASASTAVLPEQGAIWAYPLANQDEEAVIMNMVNALLGRVHLSGQLADLTSSARALVHQGITVYQQIRQDLLQGLPLWPLGLPTFVSGWTSLGMHCGDTLYLAVWRLHNASATVEIPLPAWQEHDLHITCLYPVTHPVPWNWEKTTGTLNIRFAQPFMARLFCLKRRNVNTAQ